MQLKNKKFHITTLGCRVNLFESNWISSQLEHNGAIQVSSIEEAQICIINTCSVTNTADAKSKNFIRRIQKNSNLLLSIVMGCFSQTNLDFFSKENIDIILGNKFKSKLIELIKEYSSSKVILIEDLSSEKNFEYFPIDSKFQTTRAYLKIQDGCNYMCNYCIIPLSRGRQRSLEKNNVFSSIKKLIDFNYKEIILTGVNTAGYGEDSSYKFENLLEDINILPGNFRVRISSLEPFQVTKRILDIILENPHRWCQHFHICLQSASNSVLKQMNRKYSIEKFFSLCEYIRMKNPLASITTDYIVGFPTETNSNWFESIKNLEKIHFSNMHIFPYSDRRGTRSSQLKSTVKPQEKKSRLVHLKRINEIDTSNYLKQFINRNVSVLFENSLSKKFQEGHSEYFFKVFVETKKILSNKILKIKIIRVIGDKVFGSL